MSSGMDRGTRVGGVWYRVGHDLADGTDQDEAPRRAGGGALARCTGSSILGFSTAQPHSPVLYFSTGHCVAAYRTAAKRHGVGDRGRDAGGGTEN
eukprot:3791670-Rhodomonas_salina.2